MSESEVFVYTVIPFKYNLLIVLDILREFPGIADEEKITISSEYNFICLCVPFASLLNAARGSP